MPYIINNNTFQANSGLGGDIKYDYDYPEGLDLTPTKEFHGELLSRLLRYGLESSRLSTQRHKVWNAMDEKLTAYIPITEKEKRIQDADRRKPVSIVFPYSYAILETLVSYLVAAFFPEPMFRYEGMGPEDVAGSTLLEKVVSLHCVRNKVALNLHTMFRDACAYGFGVVSPQWSVKLGTKINSQELSGLDDGGARYSRGRTRSVRENEVLFEGNALVNIDPYCYLPDPSVPIHDVQRGEYVGWMDRTNIMNLLLEEQYDSDLFNVKYVQHLSGKASSILGTVKNNRTQRQGSNYDVRMDRMISDPVDIFHVYVKLIPAKWKLGRSNVPEKWLFTVAADSIIIQAKPLGLHHNMFPVCVCAPDFDGYSPIAFSRLEILSGMQTTIDFLFNSHVANVRKAINDVLIVDPHLINMNDLRDPGAGGLVRLRQPGWGKGVKDAVMQLNITDITRANIQDVSAIIHYMQTIGGTDSPMMGSLRQGGPERLSAQEFQGTAQGAVSRLERVAKIIGIQVMQDIGLMFAYHTQQLMEKSVYLRTVGDWPASIVKNFAIEEGRVKVDPTDLLIDYDVIVRDGSIAGGNFSPAWTQLFQTVAANEALMGRIDIVRLFKYIASELGAKNVDQFELKSAQGSSVPEIAPTVMPDEQVAAGVNRGELVAALSGEGGF